MKSFKLSALLLCLLAAPALAAPPGGDRVFASRSEVARDAELRLSRSLALPGKATMPANSNYVRVEGDVTVPYGFAFRVAVPGDETRFECASALAGCNLLNPVDHVLVYGHLGGAVGCFDGPTAVAWVNLIYRQSLVKCGDGTCEIWTLI